jgi:hypothetical protein
LIELGNNLRENLIAPIKSKTGKTRRRKVMGLKPNWARTARLPIKAKPPKDGDAKPGA